MIEFLRNELERWVRKFRVPRCPVPFIVVFRERSGSSYLCSVLRNHPQITCRSEDFHDAFSGVIDNPEAREDPKNLRRRIQNFDGSRIEEATRKDVIGHMYDIFSFPTEACGFKLKYRIQFDLFPEILAELKHIPNMRLIVLSRRNLIKQAVSRQNLPRVEARAGGANLVNANDSEPVALPRFLLDVESAVKYARNSSQQQADFEDSVKQLTGKSGIPTMDVDYSELLKDHDRTIQRILEFLDVDAGQSLDSREFQKATPDRLSDAITNYDELLKVVQGTEFLPMLEDEDV